MSLLDVERRKNLNKQLDEVFHEFERLENDLSSSSMENYRTTLEQIDRWENQRKEEIKLSAVKARRDLEKIFQRRKSSLKDSLRQTVAEPLRMAIDDRDQFNERDIDIWFANLSALRRELENFSSSIDVREKKISFEIRDKFAAKNLASKLDKDKIDFLGVTGEVRIDPFAKTIDVNGPSLIISKESFSSGSHFFRFRISRSSSNLFFGVVSSVDLHRLSPKSEPISSIHGWWNADRSVIADKKQPYFSSFRYFNQDEIIFILNCNARQLYLDLVSMRRIKRLQMIDDLQLCSSPWHILIQIGRNQHSSIKLIDHGRMDQSSTFLF